MHHLETLNLHDNSFEDVGVNIIVIHLVPYAPNWIGSLSEIVESAFIGLNLLRGQHLQQLVNQ